MSRTAFFAYPAEPPGIGDSVSEASKTARTGEVALRPWPSLNIYGLKIDRLIREKIRGADFLLADITHPNFNVYYEIGYCVGAGKPFVPTVNSSIMGFTQNVNMTGLFDTTGQLRYQNGEELYEKILAVEPEAWLNHYIHDRDHAQPLFLLDSLRKTDFRNYIVQTIGSVGVQMRVFDPDEVPRLALNKAIAEVSSSTGVVIPLLSPDIEDSLRHNLRAAFLAGLSHALAVEPLIIQYDNTPAPVDFRDYIKTDRSRREVKQSVGEYCQATLVRNQQRRPVIGRRKRTLLEKIDIGSSAAENESPRLADYFVRTAEFARALRSAGAIVVGRKGSGKSAVFFQVFDDKASDRRNLVIDLRPASHNLSELREQLLSAMSVGLFDHTIAAFWQYIVYTEILLKVREVMLPKAKYNFRLLEKMRDIEEKFRLTEEMVAADFTSRLDLVVQLLIGALEQLPRDQGLKEGLTNLLYEGQLPDLRDTIVDLASDFDSIVFLFDNIDKGWPARGVEEPDVRMVRHLIGVLDKIQRELQRKKLGLQYLLFLRSDVYERLVEETSDRGKYNLIKVDWSDASQLEHLIRMRVLSGVDARDEAAAWEAVNPALGNGRSAVEEMIRSSLMRPRFLIDLCEKAVSFAINRGHTRVEEDDVHDAIAQHSRYLVSEFGYEVRDTSGVSEKLFLSFIGQSDMLTEDEVCEILKKTTTKLKDRELIQLLMWYGFLGIPDAQGRPIFIYDRDYDMRRLEAEREKHGDEILFMINPAFLRGLER